MTEPANLSIYLRQKRAVRTAQFSLKQRFARIEWEELVLKPELEEDKERLASGLVVEPILIEEVNENSP